jgi:hypothetical protein
MLPLTQVLWDWVHEDYIFIKSNAVCRNIFPKCIIRLIMLPPTKGIKLLAVPITVVETVRMIILFSFFQFTLVVRFLNTEFRHFVPGTVVLT